MLTKVFLIYIQIAVHASLFLILVLLLRATLKNASKKYACFLWLLVFFRFLIPGIYTVTFSTDAGIAGNAVNTSEKAIENKEINTGLNTEEADFQGIPDWVLNMAGANEQSEEESLSADNYNKDSNNKEAYNIETYEQENEEISDVQDIAVKEHLTDVSSKRDSKEAFKDNSWPIVIGMIFWLTGSCVFLVKGIFAYLTMRKCCQDCEAISILEFGVKEETIKKYRAKDRIYLSKKVKEPISFGFLHPAVYLPDSIKESGEPEQIRAILIHECMHIQRFDTVKKLFVYFVFCFHFWNPLMWIALKLYQKDLEMACDEAVLGTGVCSAREYAKVLLEFSMKRSGLNVFPAFGESDTESRMKNALKKKQKSLWITVIFVVVMFIAISVFFIRPAITQKENAKTDKVDKTETINHDEMNANNAKSLIINELPEAIACDNLENLGEELRLAWKEKLLTENKLITGQELYGNVCYPIALRGDDIGGVQLFTFDETGIPTFFYTYFHYQESEGKYEVSEFVSWDGSDVDSLEKANLYNQTTDMRENQFWFANGIWGNPLSFLLDSFGDSKTSDSFLQLMDEAGVSKDDTFGDLCIGLAAKHPESFLFLQDKDAAIQKLLHLSNVKSMEYVPYNLQGEFAIITFSDESQLSVCVKKSGKNQYGVDLYMIDSVCYFNLEKARQLEETLLMIDVNELKKRDQLGVEEEYNESHEYQEKYSLLQLNQEKDVALYGVYGMYGYDAIVVRVKDQAYPIRTSLGMHYRTDIWVIDLDKDGEDEYLIPLIDGWGTGYYSEELCVMKIKDDTPELFVYDSNDFRYVSERISTSIHADSHTITYYLDDPEKSNPLGEISYMVDEEAACTGLGFGEQMGFYEDEGKVYLWAEGGICYENRAQPDYDTSVNLVAPIYMDEAGCLIVSEVSLEKREYIYHEID